MKEEKNMKEKEKRNRGFSETSGTEALAAILSEFGAGGSGSVGHQPNPHCEGQRDHSPQTMTDPNGDSRDLSLDIPLMPNWSVVYRSQRGELRDGVVHRVKLGPTGWLVTLMDGGTIAAQYIRAVGETLKGKVVKAWLVRNHGLDGRRGGYTLFEETQPYESEKAEGGDEHARAPPQEDKSHEDLKTIGSQAD